MDFEGMSKKKKKKKKGGAFEEPVAPEDPFSTYLATARRKSRRHVRERSESRPLAFHAALGDLRAAQPGSVGTEDASTAAAAARGGRVARLKAEAVSEFGSTKRPRRKYTTLEEFEAALQADLANGDAPSLGGGDGDGDGPGSRKKSSKKSKKSSKDLVVVAAITSVEPHPSSERHVIVTLDAGGSTEMCVSTCSTLDEGQLVVFARLGAKLPDGLVMEKVKLKGVESKGMICSPKNLQLGEADSTPFDATGYAPGTRFRDIYEDFAPGGDGEGEAGTDTGGGEATDAADTEFGSKKKKKKKSSKGDGDGGEADSEFGSKKKKKKDKKKKVDVEDETDVELLQLIGEREAPPEADIADVEVEGMASLTMGANMSAEQQLAAKRRMQFLQKTMAEANQEDEARYGTNTKVEHVSAPAKAPKKLTAKQKKALKKKQEQEELDKLLETFESGPEPEAAAPAAAAAPDADGSGEPAAEGGDKPLSASQKKKLKKERQRLAKLEKDKQKNGASADAPQGSDDAPEKLTLEYIKTKPKHVQQILMLRMQEQEAEEEAQRLEAELRAAEEVEAAAEAEREAIAAKVLPCGL
jgi:tRNA-binding EMAP/Myf-like protein